MKKAIALLGLVLGLFVASQVLAATGVTPSRSIRDVFLQGTVRREGVTINVPCAGGSKVGATAGWTVAAASDVSEVTCANSITNGTFVIPIRHLKTGDIITGYKFVGNYATSGNTCTITANLRWEVPGATGPTDASLATVALVSQTYSAAVSGTTLRVSGIAHTILGAANYYFLVTGKTGASVSITAQALNLDIVQQ